MSLFGLVMVHSASVNVGMEDFGDPNYYIRKQVIWFGLGLFGMLVTAAIDYHYWQRLAAPMFFLTLGLLILVLLFPNDQQIKSWAQIGPLTFQTSEPAKLTFILFFAAWLSKRQDQIKSWFTFVSFLVIVLLLTVLIMMQPDFGTLSIMVTIAFTMFFVAGMHWSHLLSFITLGVVGSIYYILGEPYRLQRITTFLHPESDLEGAGYHLRNIFITVGSGSWWGLGLGLSRQKRLFLPAPHTDSIFAVIVEELGFVRALFILLAILYLVWIAIKVAAKLDDLYAKMVVVGIAAWVFWQTFFNIGAIIGLVPLTGVPLPFISYGGTSLFVLMCAMGIVLNISKHRHRAI